MWGEEGVWDGKGEREEEREEEEGQGGGTHGGRLEAAGAPVASLPHRRVFPPPPPCMSAEFDNVLTNQPVVIDNVSRIFPTPVPLRPDPVLLGLGHHQGWLCWSGSAQLLLPLIVRSLVVTRLSEMTGH